MAAPSDSRPLIYIASGKGGEKVRNMLDSSLHRAGFRTVISDEPSDHASAAGAREAAAGAVVVVAPPALQSPWMAREIAPLLERAARHESFDVVPLPVGEIGPAELDASELRDLAKLRIPAGRSEEERIVQVIEAFSPLKQPEEPTAAPPASSVPALDITRPVIVSASEDGTIRTWDATTGTAMRTFTERESRLYAVAAFTLDARAALVSGGSEGIVRIWDAERGGLLHALRGHNDAVWSVAAVDRSEGPLAVSGGMDGTVRIWDPRSGALLHTLGGHEEDVDAVAAASVDGRTIGVSGGRNGIVQVWDAATAEVLHSFTGPDVYAVAAASVEGRAIVVTGGRDGIAVVHDGESGEMRQRLVHRAGIHALAAAVEDGEVIVASGGDDAAVRVWDVASGREISTITGYEGAVYSLAFGRLGGSLVVVSGGERGAIRVCDAHSGAQVVTLTDAPEGETPFGRVAVAFAELSRPLRDHVEWVTDSPATDDLLRREPLAEALADRLVRIRNDERTAGTSFLVHVDGPWGSGKSTLLEFIRKHLDKEGWLVVRFDAWRESRVGPPWWSLMMALRHELAGSLGRADRAKLWFAEVAERLRRAGAPYVLGLVLMVAVAVGLFFLLRPDELDTTGVGDLAKTVSAIVAALATVWAGAIVVSRFLFFGSATGARLYEQSQEDPMESLAEHFRWLIGRAGRPVVFFIDDLDRCSETYVVDLLEAVQTLIRDVSKRLRRTRSIDAPYFVIAADGAWLRRSFEQAYGHFESAVGEPGRPLGYLFLDKVFQLTVPVPAIGSSSQESFLGELLELQADRRDLAEEKEQVAKQVQASTNRSEAVHAYQNASAAVRSELAPTLVKKLNEESVVRTTEHALRKFATLLEPNPRAMKRFLNAFGIADSVLVLQDVVVPQNPLALWTILRVRWPALAEYLRLHPDAVDDLVGKRGPPNGVPDELALLFQSEEVARVVGCPEGGPLTPELVRKCCGVDGG